MHPAVIYACSHRGDGNSDRAAALLAQGVAQAGGRAEILRLRRFEVRPCLACGFCDDPRGGRERSRCVLGEQDQAWDLFAPLLTARLVLVASPIYFYHLPSRLKTWIDRSQPFWRARQNREPWQAALPRRPARAVFVAGQPEGRKLFEGAGLTLRYFVNSFNLDLAEPLVLRGLDGPDDLAGRAADQERIAALGRAAWAEAAQPEGPHP